MPKPLFGINGSGMHVHQSLWDIEKGRNAFADPKDAYGLSTIATQLHRRAARARARHVRASSRRWSTRYKRLVPGYEAPVYVGWARINRSALIRIPQIRAGQHDRDADRAALPGPVLQPVPGLRRACWRRAWTASSRSLPLPEPVEENLYHFDDAKLASRNIQQLPGTLGEALDELRAGRVIARRARRPRLRALRRGQDARSGTNTGCRSPPGRSSATWRPSEPALERSAVPSPRGHRREAVDERVQFAIEHLARVVLHDVGPSEAGGSPRASGAPR